MDDKGEISFAENTMIYSCAKKNEKGVAISM